MTSTLNLSQRCLNAAPVIITSPSTRCGTTLVQRLLCASDNAFIYGEQVGAQFRELTGLFAHHIRWCEDHGAAMDETFQLALGGLLRDWRPGLTPPSQVVLDAWTEVFYHLPMALAAFGEAVGRPVWGFKWPGCPAPTLRAFLALMPQTRVVYVVRNAVDALKSAKARRFVCSSEDAAGYCANWAGNLRGAMAMADDPRMMVLRYEDLIADRESALAALCALTGAQNVRRSEFDLKVNTFEGEEADGHSPTQYIEPAVLTEADWSALREQAGEVMAEHYPTMLAA
jgi:hypothetical protein